MSALFPVDDAQACLLTEADLPELQALFERSPDYFLRVNGTPPRSNEAAEEFGDRPPADFGHKDYFVLGLREPDGMLRGMAIVVSDLMTEGCWHIGLLLIDAEREGSGLARAFYSGLEQWASAGGARWIRLGVVGGNWRAERFWHRCGFTELRRREGIEVGTLTHTIHVMLKPLGGNSVDAYLERVERDRPAAD